MRNFFIIFFSCPFALGCPQIFPPTITAPVPRQIAQRDGTNHATITITATTSETLTSAEAKADVESGGIAVGWTTIYTGSTSPFSGTLSLTPGRYNIFVRTVKASGIKGPAGTVGKIGVGELFILAGQSLMGNWGQTMNTVNDDRISAVDESNNWRLANDPQPFTDGTVASPVPAIGNALVAQINMPIGFLDASQGGTSTTDWINTLYASRLKPGMTALGNKFRAILWENGQADGTLPNTTLQYETNMQTLITNSRADAGFTVPWGIADRSTILNLTAFPTIQTAQDWLVTPGNVSTVFAGSNSDSISNTHRFDNTHFDASGQVLQGGMWATAIENFFGW